MTHLGLFSVLRHPGPHPNPNPIQKCRGEDISTPCGSSSRGEESVCKGNGLEDHVRPGFGQDTFPAEIIETNGGVGSRPDDVIWSMSTKVVVWIELTCPWEDNMSK